MMYLVIEERKGKWVDVAKCRGAEDALLMAEALFIRRIGMGCIQVWARAGGRNAYALFSAMPTSSPSEISYGAAALQKARESWKERERTYLHEQAVERSEKAKRLAAADAARQLEEVSA